MVYRTIEIKEICFDVPKEKQKEVAEKIKKLYPDLKIEMKDMEVTVRGDLHNYKKRDRIINILSGEKDGKNL